MGRLRKYSGTVAMIIKDWFTHLLSLDVRRPEGRRVLGSVLKAFGLLPTPISAHLQSLELRISFSERLSGTCPWIVNAQ
jgi:hypothetical protein